MQVPTTTRRLVLPHPGTQHAGGVRTETLPCLVLFMPAIYNACPYTHTLHATAGWLRAPQRWPGAGTAQVGFNTCLQRFQGYPDKFAQSCHDPPRYVTT